MRKRFTFLIAAIAAILMMTLPEKVVGQVVSGTTYNTTASNSFPSNWSYGGTFNTTNKPFKYLYSGDYIQTDEFTQYGFTDITLKARKYGGPTSDQARISVSWYDVSTKTEIVLGTIEPTSTTLSNYSISSISNPTAGGPGYIKIQCKNATSSVCSGVSQVTITYRTCTPSTSTLAFGNVAVGANSTKTFTLTTATLASNLTLTPSSGFTVYPASIASNATSTTVSVTCTPTAAGSQNGTLTISGGSLLSNVVVTLTATGITGPSCTVEPETYDFENVAVNGSKSQTFTVTTANLAGDLALSMSNDKYTVDPNVIEQGAASKEVTITFAPTETGTVDADLLVNGSGFENELVATVSGNGATPYTITLHPGTGS